MKCLETRRTPEGFRRRRYESNGVRFSTIEVPMAVWKAVNRPSRVAQAVAGRKSATDRALRRIRGVQLLRAGWKPAAVANEVGVSEAAVRQWRKAAGL